MSDPGFEDLELLQQFDRCGISRGLVYSSGIGPGAWRTQNRLSLSSATAEPRFLPCGVTPLFPCGPNETPSAMIEEAIASGCLSFRLDPELGPAFSPLNPEDLDFGGPIWEIMAARQVPLLIPAAHFPGSAGGFAYGLPDVLKLCAAYAKLPIVLLNPAYTQDRTLRRALERAPNLHVSISRLGLFGQLESLVKQFGADRFLFGSGLPFNDPAIARGVVTFAELDPADIQLIAGGNLLRLLNLVVAS